MINKRVNSPAAAVADIHDGATVMIGGFGTAGLPDELTDALNATQAAVIVSTHDRQLLRDVDGWPSLRLAAPTESEALV